MKKILLSIALACFTSAYGEYTSQTDCFEGTQYYREPLNETCYGNEYYGEYFDQTCCCGTGYFEVGAEWIYWKAFQDNLDYAIHVVNTPGTETLVSPTILFPDFELSSGFRVFAGYGFCDNPWEIEGIYTRWTSSTRSPSLSLDPANIGNNFIVLNNQGFPIFNVIVMQNVQLSNIDTFWNLKVNYFDLDFSRTFCVCRCLEFAPHMGLRGWWMRQELNLQGSGPGGEGAPDNQFFCEFKEKFEGYGIEGGLNGSLDLIYGFSLVGHFGGSLLYSRIASEKHLLLTNVVESIDINVDTSIHHLTPTIDAFLGLEYEGRCWCFPITLNIGWEQHIIFNNNNFAVFSYADLTLQGLTLGGSIAF